MPDQTPEVCACGHDASAHPNRGGNDEHCFLCAADQTQIGAYWHPFRPADPTPVEGDE